MASDKPAFGPPKPATNPAYLYWNLVYSLMAGRHEGVRRTGHQE